MAKRKASSDEYELIPIKPLNDIKKEINKLAKHLKDDDKHTKIMSKILNSNVQTKNKIDETLKETTKINKRVNKILELFDSANVEEEIKEDDDELKKVYKKIDNLEEQNNKISEALKQILKWLRTKQVF